MQTEVLAKAVGDQLMGFAILLMASANIPTIRFSKKLIEKCQHVQGYIFSNSGSEANEKAFKNRATDFPAEAQWQRKGQNSLPRNRDYHGTTITTLFGLRPGRAIRCSTARYSWFCGISCLLRFTVRLISGRHGQSGRKFAQEMERSSRRKIRTRLAL